MISYLRIQHYFPLSDGAEITVLVNGEPYELLNKARADTVLELVHSWTDFKELDDYFQDVFWPVDEHEWVFDVSLSPGHIDDLLSDLLDIGSSVTMANDLFPNEDGEYGEEYFERVKELITVLTGLVNEPGYKEKIYAYSCYYGF